MLIKWFRTNRELRRLAESLEMEVSRLRQAISQRDQVITKVQALVRALRDVNADLDEKLMERAGK